MISANNTLIGLIHEINGADFVASLISDAEGFVNEVEMGHSTVRVGQVGSYLVVEQSGPDVLVVVESMWLEDNIEGELVRKVRLNPLGEFSIGSGFHRGVSHYPTTGAELHLISAARLEGIFASFKAANFCIGNLSSFSEIEVYLDAAAFFGRHTAILGQSGSGKSWTVARLIQSTLVAMPNAHIVLLDPHNEYTNNYDFTRPVFPADKVRSIKASDLEIPYWLLPYEDLIDLLIDKSEEHASLQIAFLRSSVLELKRVANKDSDIGHITVDSPVYFPLDDLYQQFKEANERTDNFGKSKTALTGKFDSLLIKLESRLNDSRYDFLLRPKKRISSDTLADLMRDFVGLGNPEAAVTIIDLSTVPYDVQPTVTAQIGRMAFEFNFWNPRCREFPLFILCEEAHNYIPRDSDEKFAASRQTFERIAKTGRKYGVGLGLVSQRPHDLSETVLSQCSSYLCMRITNPNDQDYIRSLVPDAAHGMLSALSSLAQGEVLAIGEASPLPLRMKVNLPEPPPNAQNIDYLGMWSKETSRDMDVADIVSRWRSNRH